MYETRTRLLIPAPGRGKSGTAAASLTRIEDIGSAHASIWMATCEAGIGKFGSDKLGGSCPSTLNDEIMFLFCERLNRIRQRLKYSIIVSRNPQADE